MIALKRGPFIVPTSLPRPFNRWSPIVILKDVSYDDLDSVVQFMYNGIVNVSSDKLPAVLKVVKADPTLLTHLTSKFIQRNDFLTDCRHAANKRFGGEIL